MHKLAKSSALAILLLLGTTVALAINGDGAGNMGTQTKCFYQVTNHSNLTLRPVGEEGAVDVTTIQPGKIKTIKYPCDAKLALIGKLKAKDRGTIFQNKVLYTKKDPAKATAVVFPTEFEMMTGSYCGDCLDNNFKLGHYVGPFSSNTGFKCVACP